MTEYMQALTRLDSTKEPAKTNIFREYARLFDAIVGHALHDTRSESRL